MPFTVTQVSEQQHRAEHAAEIMKWAYGFLLLALGKTLDGVINSCQTDVKQAAHANFGHFSFGDTPPLVFRTRFVLHSHTGKLLLYSARNWTDVNSPFRCDKIVGPSDSTTLIRWKYFGYWKLNITWKSSGIMMHHCSFIYRARQILMTCNVPLNKDEYVDVVLHRAGCTFWSPLASSANSLHLNW